MGYHTVHPFVYMSLSSFVTPFSAGFRGGTNSSHLKREVDVDVAQVVRRRAADLQRTGGRPPLVRAPAARHRRPASGHVAHVGSAAEVAWRTSGCLPRRACVFVRGKI